jgi:hypothetical protein
LSLARVVVGGLMSNVCYLCLLSYCGVQHVLTN